MTETENIDALRKYILSGKEMVALQKIADLSASAQHRCDTLSSIHEIASAVLRKIQS